MYKDEEGVKYTVVLGQTDVVAKKNSFYKLQVLKADNGDKYVVYWWNVNDTPRLNIPM